MQTFNELKDSLTATDINELVKLISCNSGKDEHLKRVLSQDNMRNKIPIKPILARLFKDTEWRFFAIIDFRSEIKMVRKILMEVLNG